MSIMVGKHSLQRTGVTAFVFFFAITMQANAFSGGSGTRVDPYLIATAEDLMSIGSDPDLLQSHFRLVNAIDLDPNLPGGKVFAEPLIAPHVRTEIYSLGIGNGRFTDSFFEGQDFAGTFDGSGYRISNLTMDGAAMLGLFGKIGPTGQVHNLVLRGASINGTGRTVTGMLTAENDGTIVDCQAEGVIHASKFAGALVAINNGIVGYSSGSGTIHGDGGLVANNTGLIRACYAATALGSKESMLLGRGGLVGTNTGTIIDCYVAGEMRIISVDSSPRGSHLLVGGLVGENWGTVANCYTTAQMMVDPQVREAGPLIGHVPAGGPIRYAYYLETNAAAFHNDMGISLSQTALRDPNTFVHWDFHGNELDGNFDTWFMPDNGAPVLSWQSAKTGLVRLPLIGFKTLEDITAQFERMGLVAGEIQYDHDEDIPKARAIRTRVSGYVALGAIVDIVMSLGAYDCVIPASLQNLKKVCGGVFLGGAAGLTAQPISGV